MLGLINLLFRKHQKKLHLNTYAQVKLKVNIYTLKELLSDTVRLNTGLSGVEFWESTQK